MKQGIPRWTVVVLIAVSVLSSAHSCEEELPGCSDACSHLINCENEWLIEEGESEMSEQEEESFRGSCMNDCTGENSPQNRIDCIVEASCDELAEGDCI